MQLSTPSTPKGFVERVIQCKSLKPFVVTIYWFNETCCSLMIKHPYGAPKSLTIFALNGSTCETETGTPLYAADVAFRLRKLLREKTRA